MHTFFAFMAAFFLLVQTFVIVPGLNDWQDGCSTNESSEDIASAVELELFSPRLRYKPL